MVIVMPGDRLIDPCPARRKSGRQSLFWPFLN